jgi:AraC-like DNA-binding protein
VSDLLPFVGFFGAAQALVIAILVGTLPAPRIRFLATLLGTLGLAMGLITLSYLPVGRSMPFLYAAEVAVSLFAPPVLYLWVRLTVRGETALPRRAWLHFLPTAAWLAIAAGLLLQGEPVDERVAPIEAVMAVQMLYTGSAVWRLFGRKPAPRAVLEEVRLARLTVGLFLLMHGAQIVRWLSDAPVFRHVVPFTGAVIVFALTALAIRRSRLFQPQGGARTRGRYQQSTLTEEVAAAGLERLRQAMEETRAFLRPDLTLNTLAEEIGVPRSHLSQLVNERRGKSFPELLTEYRVEEARRLLVDPDLDHLTVESIGQRSGFHSRSAFFEAFKRATGKPPAAYRKDRPQR